MTTRSNAIAAAIAACAFLLAVPAAAVDGEILIDQARVNAGGITPGDAPGFPATLSRPGRYISSPATSGCRRAWPASRSRSTT